MKAYATKEEILDVIAASGGCTPSECVGEACICRIQALAMMTSFRVGRRALKSDCAPGPSHYSPQETEILIRMVERGVKLSQIAQTLNRSYGSVYVKAHKLQSKGILGFPATDGTNQMTQRQKQTLDVIKAFWAENGYAPSYEIIGKAMNIKSRSSVSAIIKNLEASGYVTKHPNRARTVRPTELPA